MKKPVAKSRARPAARPLTEFTRGVIAAIKKIPAGRVATYGQIALLAGRAGGARGVVWILHSCSEAYDLPWHRVVNAEGLIAIPADRKNHREQKRRLQAEGVPFTDVSHVDLELCQWSRRAPLRRKKTTENSKGPRLFADTP